MSEHNKGPEVPAPKKRKHLIGSPRKGRDSDVALIPFDDQFAPADSVANLEAEKRSMLATIAQLEETVNGHGDAIEIYKAQINEFKTARDHASERERSASVQIENLSNALKAATEANQSVRDQGKKKVSKLQKKLADVEKALEASEGQLDRSVKSNSRMNQIVSDLREAVNDQKKTAGEELSELEDLICKCIPELPFAAVNGVTPTHNIPLSALRRCIAHTCGYRSGKDQEGDEGSLCLILDRIKTLVASRPASVSTPVYFLCLLIQLAEDPNLSSGATKLVEDHHDLIRSESVQTFCHMLSKRTRETLDDDNDNQRVMSPNLVRISTIADACQMPRPQRDRYIIAIITAWRTEMTREFVGTGALEDCLKSHFEDVEEWCAEQNMLNLLNSSSEVSKGQADVQDNDLA